MKAGDLETILNRHKEWLGGSEDGKRANLREANLREADLREANLREADLREADLREANLRGANLREADLREANLREADLREADLREADLRGADIDYSCWPLWCGSFDVKVDKRIFAQLAYHLCRVVVDDDECKVAQRALTDIANQFHRVGECGRIEVAPLMGVEVTE